MRDLQLRNDGTSFLGLIRIFWQRKLLIVLITLFFLASTLIYIYNTKSTYDAKVFILAPETIDLSKLNVGAFHQQNSQTWSRYPLESMYKKFTGNLLSEHIKREFFNKIYLPYLNQTQEVVSTEAAWNKFLRVFKIKIMKNKLYVITAESDSSEQSENMIKDYLALAQKKTWDNLKQDMNNRITEKLLSIEAEMAFNRTLSDKYTIAQLTSLYNALKESKAAKIETGPSISKTLSLMPFMLGENVLNVKIKNLENELINPDLISTFNNLEADKVFYSSIKISDDSQVDFYQLDGPIITSDIPSKPKRGLLLLLGCTLGVLMGCIAIILLDKFKHFKLTSYAVERA